VPIPRRFDRRPPERDQTRINERIRVPEVRLIGEDGNQVGVLSRDDALAYARQRDLDLVEVAAEARPPVCRVLDYSKYKYEQEQKAKQARKHQKQVTVREIKLRPKIATNDYETKKNHVERFLKHQDRVKITIMFRGRETTHPERGERLLMQLAEDVSEWGTIEQRPNLDGRNMTMLLAPVRQKEAAADEQAASDGSAAAAADAAPAAADAAPAAADAPAAAPPAAAAPPPPDDAGAEPAVPAPEPAAPEPAAPEAPEAAAPPAAADDAA
jgi:translation initiation factor IF-3